MNRRQRTKAIKEIVNEHGPDDVVYDKATIAGAWEDLTLEQKYARAYAAAQFGGRVIGSFAASSDMGGPEIDALLGDDEEDIEDDEEGDEDDDDEEDDER